MSPRLTPQGSSLWVTLFEEAIREHDDNWLGQQLERRGLMLDMEPYTRSGIMRTRKVPVGAALQLAEGEFNRFYLRGLCLRAKEEGLTHLLVYRGKAVTHPRPESEAKIGSLVPVDILLADLRQNDFVDTALGLPSGPNSGITARLAR